MNEPAEMDATLYVPLPGLVGEAEGFQIAGLVVERLDVRDWWSIENNRTKDMYGDEYQVLPRYFVAEPITDFNDGDEWNRVTAAASTLVFSMLLCGRGDLIAPYHTTIVARSSGGMNLRRPPDRNTSRFLAVTFGEDLPVFDTGRELSGLGGELYVLTAERVAVIEEMFATVQHVELRAETEPKVASVLAAGHNYAQARSFLLTPRVRFVALFTAIEFLLGEFGRVGDRPGLGHLLATLHVDGDDRAAVGDEVEQHLRTFRNEIVHGGRQSPDNILQFLDELLPLVQPLIRSAYVLAVDDDRHDAAAHALEARVSDHPARVLRSLLRAAYRGSSDADAALAGLDLRSAITDAEG